MKSKALFAVMVMVLNANTNMAFAAGDNGIGVGPGENQLLCVPDISCDTNSVRFHAPTRACEYNVQFVSPCGESAIHRLTVADNLEQCRRTCIKDGVELQKRQLGLKVF